VLRNLSKRLLCSAGYQKIREMITLTPEERILDMAFAFAWWARPGGDYLEFGLHRGGGLTAAYHLARKNKLPDMRFIGFDSFDGMPESTNLDRFPVQQFHRGELRCDRRTVERNLRGGGVDMSRVRLVEGWFADSLTTTTRQELGLERAAVVKVDCDLYESTVPVLEFVLPLLRDGTVLIVDDWFLFRAHPDLGQRRAVTEWLDRCPDIEVTPFMKTSWHEASFIVHVRDESTGDVEVESGGL
jgi:hypothetical protein